MLQFISITILKISIKQISEFAIYCFIIAYAIIIKTVNQFYCFAIPITIRHNLFSFTSIYTLHFIYFISISFLILYF